MTLDQGREPGAGGEGSTARLEGMELYAGPGDMGGTELRDYACT